MICIIRRQNLIRSPNTHEHQEMLQKSVLEVEVEVEEDFYVKANAHRIKQLFSHLEKLWIVTTGREDDGHDAIKSNQHHIYTIQY